MALAQADQQRRVPPTEESARAGEERHMQVEFLQRARGGLLVLFLHNGKHEMFDVVHGDLHILKRSAGWVDST